VCQCRFSLRHELCTKIFDLVSKLNTYTIQGNKWCSRLFKFLGWKTVSLFRVNLKHFLHFQTCFRFMDVLQVQVCLNFCLFVCFYTNLVTTAIIIWWNSPQCNPAAGARNDYNNRGHPQQQQKPKHSSTCKAVQVSSKIAGIHYVCFCIVKVVASVTFVFICFYFFFQHAINFCSLMLFFFLLLHLSYFVI